MAASPARASDAELELAARLRLAIGRIGRRMRTDSGVGPTPSQVSALATIDRHGPIRIGDLAARERVTAPTMTRVVAVLEQQGYVARTADPVDGRSWLIALSEPGRHLLATINRDRTRYLAAQLTELDHDQHRLLEAALPVLESIAGTEPDP